MSKAQTAVIADVHGNRWALEAVLADIERRAIQQVVNLGDALYGPLDPAGTADLLLARDILTVRGNGDRILVTPPPDSHTSPSLGYTRQNLAPAHLDWLARLPLTAIVQDTFFLCHGTPSDDQQYLLEAVTERGVSLRDGPQLASLLAGVDQPVVLCGHSHRPGSVTLPGGKLVVNPGSVGLPAYRDDLPHPHRMEAGTPHARYAILSATAAGWRVEQVAVPYDWHTPARMAGENGRPDWATGLRTGRAPIPAAQKEVTS